MIKTKSKVIMVESRREGTVVADLTDLYDRAVYCVELDGLKGHFFASEIEPKEKAK